MASSSKKRRVETNVETTQSVEMEPEVAKKLLVEGATIVFRDVPPGTQVGIDMNSWNVGEKFMGIKMIPPGIHFIYYSAVNLATRSTAPRTGFFYNFGRGEMLVRRWDPVSEDLIDDVKEEDKTRMKQDIKNLDKHLGVYPYNSWKKWISLSSHITEATLIRLEPMCKKICSVADLIPDSNSNSKDTTDPRLPAMISRPGTSIRYSNISDRKFPTGSSPAEITMHCMDTTHQLGLLIGNMEKLYGDQVSSSMSHQDSGKEVLAEVQFAFLAFLVGMNYDSFEHWKKLIIMMCSCDDGLSKYSALFLDFITMLYFQMKEVPSDFFVDIVSSSNFLSTSLNILFSNVKNSQEVDSSLKQKATKFEANVTKKFGWDFTLDLNEEAPVVVENIVQ